MKHAGVFLWFVFVFHLQACAQQEDPLERMQRDMQQLMDRFRGAQPFRQPGDSLRFFQWDTTLTDGSGLRFHFGDVDSLFQMREGVDFFEQMDHMLREMERSFPLGGRGNMPFTLPEGNEGEGETEVLPEERLRLQEEEQRKKSAPRKKIPTTRI
jgi:hypothetical protein